MWPTPHRWRLTPVVIRNRNIVRINYRFASRHSAFRSKFGQLSLGAAFILLQYIIIISISGPAFARVDLISSTAIGCLIATAAGIQLIRSVSHYPGVEEAAYIAPAFCLSYGALLVVYIIYRLPYSRILLTSSFLVNIVIFLILASIMRRATRLSIGLIASGDVSELTSVVGVDWRLLDIDDCNVEDIDAVSVDLRSDISDEWERKLAVFALQGLPVYHTKHLLESLTGKVEIEHLSENSFGTLTPLLSYMRVKQVLDMLAALFVLVFFFPLLVIIAIAVKSDSSGPILFRQTRIGYRGTPFRVFKFRTMTPVSPTNATAPDALEAAKTKDGDKRITRLGAFLRHSRLDELPQLLNILCGEMSWIGPRPEAEVLSRWYEEEIPFYRYRHIVRPGITGWAQVNQGHVAEVHEVKSKLHFDFYYIKNFSPWIDLLIVGRTIRTMLTGFGSR